MFLTHDEVCELTDARTKAGQIENLKRNGIRHTIKRSGWPSVTKTAIMSPEVSINDKTAWQPRKVS